MLETICEFGLEQLNSSGETTTVRQRHAEWYLRFAERSARPHRRSVLGAPAELGLLEQEYANLRAALEWCAAEQPAMGLRLAAALGGYWNARDHLGDGPFWLEKMLGLDDGSEPAARVSAKLWLSMLAGTKGEHPRASALLGDATAVAQTTGDTIGLATATVFEP